MLQTSIIVVALFLGLIGYVVKFTLNDSSSVAQSSYKSSDVLPCILALSVPYRWNLAGKAPALLCLRGSFLKNQK